MFKIKNKKLIFNIIKTLNLSKIYLKMEELETIDCEFEGYENSDKTFNKLIELQDLVKKEFYLRELGK